MHRFAALVAATMYPWNAILTTSNLAAWDDYIKWNGRDFNFGDRFSACSAFWRDLKNRGGKLKRFPTRKSGGIESLGESLSQAADSGW
jgi:hypothetical protein